MIKNVVLLIVLFCAAALAKDLPRIVVYVTGNGADGETRALRMRTLSTLVKSGKYTVIERPNAFIAEVDKERERQIDDDEIRTIGKRFGADFVCIADLTSALGEFHVFARIINTETAAAEFTGDASGPLETITDLERLSDRVVKAMFRKASPQPPTATKPKPAAAPAPPPRTGNVTDTRDGKMYRTVRIGNRTWMAENLNHQTSGSWCYRNDKTNCAKYGRLYTWNAAMTVCPAGWRLPTRADWNDLVKAADKKGDPSVKLKSRTEWNRGGGGTDNFGFAAMPGGSRNVDGKYISIGSYGYWWCAAEHEGGGAYNRCMHLDSAPVHEYSSDKGNGFSVRCVRD